MPRGGRGSEEAGEREKEEEEEGKGARGGGKNFADEIRSMTIE